MCGFQALPAHYINKSNEKIKPWPSEAQICVLHQFKLSRSNGFKLIGFRRGQVLYEIVSNQ